MAIRTEGPEVQKRRLRVEIRKLRKEAGLRQQDVASEMDWSASKLIRIENGSVKITPTDVRALLRHYGVNDEKRVAELVGMARSAKVDPWADLRPSHSPDWLAYLDLEASASVIRNYESLFVPGLLQAEEYARSVYRVENLSTELADQRWDGRLRRHDLHDEDQPPLMNFVIDEAVVRREVGGKAVMRRQLERLLENSAFRHVALQILPFGAGIYRSMGRSFVLLEFPDADDDDIVYFEDERGGTVIRDSADVTSEYSDAFLAQQQQALTEDESRQLIEELIVSPSGEEIT